MLTDPYRLIPRAFHAQKEAVMSFLRAMVISLVRADSKYFILPFSSIPFFYIAADLALRGVFTDPEHGPVIYYHYTNTTIGWSNEQQLFGWNVLDFSSGWPVA